VHSELFIQIVAVTALKLSVLRQPPSLFLNFRLAFARKTLNNKNICVERMISFCNIDWSTSPNAPK
jgi:hypothetical protein